MAPHKVCIKRSNKATYYPLQKRVTLKRVAGGRGAFHAHLAMHNVNMQRLKCRFNNCIGHTSYII